MSCPAYAMTCSTTDLLLRPMGPDTDPIRGRGHVALSPVAERRARGQGHRCREAARPEKAVAGRSRGMDLDEYLPKTERIEAMASEGGIEGM